MTKREKGYIIKIYSSEQERIRKTIERILTMTNEKEKTNQNLEKIEDKISLILSDSMKSWVDLYLLLEQVRENKLYKPEHRSFTAFVRHVAEVNNVYESILWQRRKAGKTYRRYQQIKEQQGKGAKAIEELREAKVSPETLELCQKIAKKDDEAFEFLMDKAIQGEVTRDDLRKTYTTIRDKQIEEAIRADLRRENDTEDNEHAEGMQSMANDKKEHTEQDTNPKDPLKTAEISLALDSSDWVLSFAKILGTYAVEQTYIYNFARSGTGIFRTISEFPVTSITTRYDRKVDKAVFETITLAGHFLREYQICTHQVEIKVSKTDLIRDTKMQDYAQSFDYSWLCVPTELEEEALNVKPEKFGLLLYNFDNKKLTIEKTAQRQKDPMDIERTLRIGLNRLL